MKRRNSRSLPSHSEINDAFRTALNDGQGVLDFTVVHQKDAGFLALEALGGDPLARSMALAIATSVARMMTADPPALCLLCDHAFNDHAPTAFVLMKGGTDSPSTMIVNPLCSRCARPDRLHQRIYRYYRDAVSPEGSLRMLGPISPPGRA